MATRKTASGARSADEPSPIPASIDRAHLKGLRAAGNSIQLPFSKPLPEPIIKMLVKARLAELAK